MRPQRRGLSLTEVLVALFVMALGLMALLTLFPLGAMQIGQALKDDRTAQTVAQADTWVRVWWKDAVAPWATNPNALPTDPALLGMDDPNVIGAGIAQSQTTPTVINSKFYVAPYPQNTVTLLPTGAAFGTNGTPFTTAGAELRATQIIPDSAGTLASFGIATQARFVNVSSATVAQPSYPILLDPLGFTATRSGNGGLDQPWVGRNGGLVYGVATAGTVPLLLPRRTATILPSGTQAYATCALTDDMTFQANGGAGETAKDPVTTATTTNPLGRQGRYHWAALIQRPDNSVQDQANLTVLVFDGRPPFLGITGDEVCLTNGFVNGGGGVGLGDRSMTLFVPTRGSDQPPLIRRGGWVMVASLTGGVRSVGLHRVTGLVTDADQVVSGVAVTPMALDIDPPIKTTLGAAQVQVYLLAGLSEVFEKPLLTR